MDIQIGDLLVHRTWRWFDTIATIFSDSIVSVSGKTILLENFDKYDIYKKVENG